jgi:hypothetical protein
MRCTFPTTLQRHEEVTNLQLDQLLVARIRALHLLRKLVLKPDFGTAAAQDIAQFRARHCCNSRS